MDAYGRASLQHSLTKISSSISSPLQSALEHEAKAIRAQKVIFATTLTDTYKRIVSYSHKLKVS